MKNLTLSRKASPRKALLRIQCIALLRHKRIKTTLAKAKALARYVAPIITRARRRLRTNVNHAHSQAFRILHCKEADKLLFNEVLPQIKERPGGYTRIVQFNTRTGDGAKLAVVELVDFNSVFNKHKRAKTRRSRKKSMHTPLASGVDKSTLIVEKTTIAKVPEKEGKPKQV